MIKPDYSHAEWNKPPTPKPSPRRFNTPRRDPISRGRPAPESMLHLCLERDTRAGTREALTTLCDTGAYHVRWTNKTEAVTCPYCLDRIRGGEVKSKLKWESLGRETVGRSMYSVEGGIATDIPMWHISQTRLINE